jgi:outer membrane protein OmpA-like peptidoglycan-associated protein
MQARAVEMHAEGGTLAQVEVVLQALHAAGSILEVDVAAPDGTPVSDARVLVDGRNMGQTSTGGQVGLWGVAVGTRRVEVHREDLRCPAQWVTVVPTGPSQASIECDWAPGTVLVTVRTAAGPVDDALLRVAGPRGLSPVPLDHMGARIISLEPGRWRMLVSSPSAGMAEQVVDIDPGGGQRREVHFLLEPAASGASLLVRLTDTRGAPVGDAAVRVNGSSAGVTETDGSVLLSDLTPGQIILEVEAAGFERMEPIQRVLFAGAQEQLLELSWRPIPVSVRIEDANGGALQGRIDAVGPEETRPVKVTGEGEIPLPPGDWQLVASVEAYGSRGRDVQVRPGETPERALFTMRPARVEVVADTLQLRDVYFDLDADSAGPEYARILEEVASLCLANPWILKLEIQGHTDATGTLEHNMDLSERRARSVHRALVEFGLPPDRLLARGYGPLRAIADNDTPRGRAANRRVEFHITERFHAPAEQGADVH